MTNYEINLPHRLCEEFDEWSQTVDLVSDVDVVGAGGGEGILAFKCANIDAAMDSFWAHVRQSYQPQEVVEDDEAA